MGVRGLTTYIGQRAELFLKPYELYDTNLVIDGDNLACNLYKDVSECNSAFGGDYDEYYRTVVSFFHLLSECNIVPYVLLDGGYESKKMRTVEQRARNKISVIKHLNPNNSKPMFPLMMREVMLEACKDCNVNIMRCLFEADEELAALARKLNCPVLSYDSDFYIYDVKYIPMITVTMKVFEKKGTHIGIRDGLRKCEAKHLKKRKEINSGLKIEIPSEIKKVDYELNEPEDISLNFVKPKKLKKKVKIIKYLDCCIYRIEHLIGKNRLSEEKLPLFAALLGNDYIQRSAFKNFYSQVGMKGFTRRKIPKQQKQILSILRWLGHETLESATEKILARIKKNDRLILLTRMNSAINGYSNEKSDAFDFFGLTEEDCDSETSVSDCEENHIRKVNDNETYDSLMNEEIIITDECSEFEYDEKSSEHSLVDNDLIDKSCNSNSSHEFYENISENANSKNEYENDLVKNDINLAIESSLARDRIPIAIQNRIFKGTLPRYISDLFYQSLYINTPQIENFSLPDAHSVALPILLQIFTLLFYSEKRVLRYLTRVVGKTNVFYKKIDTSDFNFSNIIDFNSTKPNYKPIQECFSKLKIDIDILFTKLFEIPTDLQLYFLGIIYWMNNSKNVDVINLKSILICLIILRTCDSKVEPIRNEKKFHKKFSKILKKEKNFRGKTIFGEIKEIKIEKRAKLLDKLSPNEKIKFIPKIECLLVLENILKYFHYKNSTLTSHTEFSSTTIHVYSEFQGVCLQLYTLNSLCNLPFEHFKLSQLFNGVFLYNINENLKQRPDINHYIKMHLFKSSEIMYEFFIELENWFKPFIPLLENDICVAEKSIPISKKLLKKQRQIQKKKLNIENKKLIGIEDMIESSKELHYNDLNNKFQTLAVN